MLIHLSLRAYTQAARRGSLEVEITLSIAVRPSPQRALAVEACVVIKLVRTRKLFEDKPHLSMVLTWAKIIGGVLDLNREALRHRILNQRVYQFHHTPSLVQALKLVTCISLCFSKQQQMETMSCKNNLSQILQGILKL